MLQFAQFLFWRLRWALSFRTGRYPHRMAMVMVETLFRMDRFLRRTVMAPAATLFRTGRFLHRTVMAPAVISVSFSFSFQEQAYSGLQAIFCEVGVWL